MQKSLIDFYNLTIKDPLFSAEGLDLDNAGWALEELQNVSKELQIIDSSLAGRIHFLLHPLSEVLHPFGFLRDFLVGERARRHFLATPTIETAKLLIKSYYKTVNSLEKDLRAYWKACLNVQNTTSKRKPLANAYYFYRSRLTFPQFNECIELMINNVKELRFEINSRNKMLLTIITQSFLKSDIAGKYTIHPKVFSETINGSRGKAKTSKEFTERMNWIQEGRDYIYYLKQRYGQINTKLFGPISYKLPHFDKKPTNHLFYISFITDSLGKMRYASAILADQFHFIELERDKYKFYADIFTYESLIRRGIKYWYQPATSFYFTSDLTYYPDLLTIADLSTRTHLNKEMLIREKSSLLDMLLWNGYMHNLSYLQNIQSRKQAGRKLGSWHYLLIGRGYPSLYYLTYNKSVWRLKESPNFYGSLSLNPSPYLSNDKLPKSLKKKDLQKIFMGGIIRTEEIDAQLSDT